MPTFYILILPFALLAIYSVAKSLCNSRWLFRLKGEIPLMKCSIASLEREVSIIKNRDCCKEECPTVCNKLATRPPQSVINKSKKVNNNKQ